MQSDVYLWICSRGEAMAEPPRALRAPYVWIVCQWTWPSLRIPISGQSNGLTITSQWHQTVHPFKPMSFFFWVDSPWLWDYSWVWLVVQSSFWLVESTYIGYVSPFLGQSALRLLQSLRCVRREHKETNYGYPFWIINGEVWSYQKFPNNMTDTIMNISNITWYCGWKKSCASGRRSIQI